MSAPAAVTCPHCRHAFAPPPGLRPGVAFACPGCQSWLVTPAGGHTVRCWKCGGRVPEEEAERRKVRTGETGGLAGGLLDVSAWFAAGHYGMVDLCGDCADEYDERERFKTKLVIGAVAVVVALFLVLVVVEVVVHR